MNSLLAYTQSESFYGMNGIDFVRRQEQWPLNLDMTEGEKIPSAQCQGQWSKVHRSPIFQVSTLFCQRWNSAKWDWESSLAQVEASRYSLWPFQPSYLEGFREPMPSLLSQNSRSQCRVCMLSYCDTHQGLNNDFAGDQKLMPDDVSEYGASPSAFVRTVHRSHWESLSFLLYEVCCRALSQPE